MTHHRTRGQTELPVRVTTAATTNAIAAGHLRPAGQEDVDRVLPQRGTAVSTDTYVHSIGNGTIHASPGDVELRPTASCRYRAPPARACAGCPGDVEEFLSVDELGRVRCLREAVAVGAGSASTASDHALWWPPTKVAAPYLAAHLERVDEGAPRSGAVTSRPGPVVHGRGARTAASSC